MSIPRDSYVPNPAMANGSDKLTHLGNDGVLNSMEGIEEAFGIEIDYYAKMNFQSLIHIVDALGASKSMSRSILANRTKIEVSRNKTRSI